MRRFALLFLALLVFRMVTGVMFADDQISSRHEYRLIDFLEEQGERLDCYFTLEQFHPIESAGKLELQYAPVKPFAPDSVKSLIKSLQEQVPDAEFRVTDSQPPVVQIRDRRLLKQQKYPLDERIEISFRGTPDGLADEITKLLPKMKRLRGGLIGDFSGDVVTSVNLKEAKGQVRDILSLAVLGKDYSRVLWRTRATLGADGIWEVQIIHFGPRDEGDE